MGPRLPAYVLVLGLASGCAGGPPPAVTPQDVPALESQSQRNPTDPELMTRLGVAYYEAKNYDRARDVLQSSLALDKNSYGTLVYLGLTYEELGQLDSARASYNKASALTKSQDQRNEISNRLALLTRKELHQAARNALAQEATLSQQAPTANAIAVLPVRYFGSDTALRPLERGVTHLMITDLSKVGRLRLLERERVQALVDEMKLSDEGRTDPATGARSGRLLRAERVVQGSLQEVPASGQLKLDADVVNTETAGVQATGSASDRLQQLFDIEKQVVMQLLQRLNIILSPAEQRALSERPTADLQAFLAFSRGLEAEDRGDYQAAEAAYNEAIARDPNFRAAKERRDEMVRVSSAASLPAPAVCRPRAPRPWHGAGSRTGPRGDDARDRRNHHGPEHRRRTHQSDRSDLDASPSESAVVARGKRNRCPGRWPLRNHHHHRDPAVRAPLRAGLLVATLLGSATRSGQAQSLFGPASIGGGAEGRRYEFEEGYVVHAIRQFAYPVAVLIPFGKRFSVDIGTAYATTTVADAIGREASFSGFTDTQLRGSYVFGNDRVVTSLMVNIPTGQETQSLKEFNVTSNVASNFLLFPVNSYGNGFSATGGLAVAIPAGSWNVGVAGSLRLNSEYQPFSEAGSTSVRYQPGLEGRIRAGADRLIGSSRLALGLTFSTFDNDQFSGLATGSGRYSPGNRLIGEVNLTSPAGSGSITAYAWDFYRTAGDNSAVATSNKENVLTFGLSGGWPLGRTVQLQPLAEARLWSPDEGSGQLYGAGAALRFTLSPRLVFAPGGRFDFGSIEQLGTSYSLTGWGFSGLLRYNF